MAAVEAIWAIHRAAREGDTEGVARMLDDEPRLVSSTWGDGGSPLLICAGVRGHVGVVRLLLERKAEVDAPNISGSTPLCYAADRGHVEVVSSLLSSGADPSRRGGWGQTALLNASRNGHVAVVRMILRSMGGRGLDQRVEDGWTALSIACYNGHADVVRALLLAGADHTIASINGQTPLQVAQQMGRHQCVAVIQWWEGELQRAYILHKARTLHDDTATRQQAPAAPVPAYLRPRVQGSMPSVEVGAMEQGAHDRTAQRGTEQEGHDNEEVVCAMVGFVVKDLDGHLYTELIQGLR